MNLWKYYNGDLKYPDLNNHSREIEIAKATPKWAYEYVERNGKNKDLEPIIAKDAKYSYWYAKFVLKGPFPLGEPAIAKDEYYSYSYTYAKNILEGPFKLGEPAIATNSYQSYEYARNILKGPFPLGEPAIAKNTEYSKEYTQEVLKKDFILNGKLICKYES